MAVLLRLVLFLAGAVLFSSWAHSQEVGPVDPGAIQRRSADALDYYRVEEKLRSDQPPETENVTNQFPDPPAAAPPLDQEVFALERIEISPSEILSPGELSAITGKYEGSDVSIGDLLAVVNEINSLYREKRFITARAVLPPQEVRGGVVRIRLVEGRIGKVSIENNRSTRSSFFSGRISVEPGALLRLDDLEDQLFRFNRLHDVKVRAEVRPGSEFATTDLILRAEEPRLFQSSVFFDNGGQQGVGKKRVGFIGTYSSLGGWRDPLTIGGYWADGTLAGFASYSFPLDAAGTRLTVSGDYNAIRVRSGSLQDLQIAGNSYGAGLKFSRPVYMNRTVAVNGFLAGHFKKSSLDSEGFPLLASRVRSLELGGDFQSFDNYGFWYSPHSVTGGFWGGEFFFKYNGSVSRQQTVPGGLIGLLRASAQLTGANLLAPAEQFQSGGLSTVRGYSEGTLIGNNGYTASAELQFPLPRFAQGVRGTVFLDHSGVFQDSNRSSLTGAGAGLILNLGQYMVGRLNWAVPLEIIGGARKVGFHFYLQSNAPLADWLIAPLARAWP